MIKLFLNLLLFCICITFFSCNDIANDNVKCATCANDTIRVNHDFSFGRVLTDGNGLTLYFLSLDTKGGSVCSGDCLTDWPIFYSEAISFAEEDIELYDFRNITREDGRKQTTYKGQPLYYFSGDTKVGEIKGDKVDDIWYVAKPDYSLMYSKAQLVGHDGKQYKSDYTEGQEETFYFRNFNNGRTLYTWKNDKFNQNKYTSSNPLIFYQQWYPVPTSFFYSTDNILDLKLPSILNKSDFGEISVWGIKQLTYKGWPLYFFGDSVYGDKLRGDTKGVSFPTPGIWPLPNVSTGTAPN